LEKLPIEWKDLIEQTVPNQTMVNE